MIRALLLIGSTNLLELTGLQDTTTGVYPADATVTASLAAPGGTAVVGAQAIPLTYVALTTGAATVYRGVVDASVALSPQVYTLTVTATDASGNVRTFTASATASAG